MVDEKHSWLLGERVYLPTTVAEGCFLGVEWEFILNPPATEAEIIACEAELGTRIPYGYREFLLQWNGAYLIS